MRLTAYLYLSKYSLLFLCLLLSVTSTYAAEIELLDTYRSPSDNPNIGLVSGMQFTADGALKVVDNKLGTLTHFDGKGVNKIELSGEGKLFKSKKISSIAAATKEGTYILTNNADGGITFVDAQGKLQKRFGEKGSSAGMLRGPKSVAFSKNGRVYVADGASVSVFSQSGIYLYSIGQNQDTTKRLKNPTHVAVDRQERVYVLEQGSSATVNVYKPSGQLITRLTALELKPLLGGRINLTAMTVDEGGNLFLADSATGKIIHFDWKTGEFITTFGSKGKGPGQYENATSLAISKDNKIAVADSRIKKIDIYKLHDLETVESDRTWLPNLGIAKFQKATCTSGFRLNNLDILCLNTKTDEINILSPEGKAKKKFEGEIKDPVQASYNDETVAVLMRNKVMVFSIDGKYKTEFGRSGSKEGQFGGAQDVYLRDKKIYVAESSNKRVQIFSKKGVYLNKVPVSVNKENPALVKPVAVAVDTNGNIYVADGGKKKVVVFSSNKDLLYEIGEPAEAPNAFKTISDLALDTDNNLYVLGSTNINKQTVQVYRGPKRFFQFGFESRKNQNALYMSNSISIAPTKKTIVSIFNADSKNPGLVSYNYLQVPAQVGDLTVAGEIEQAVLSWRKPPGNYINSFRIYGSNQKLGNYKFIKETSDLSAAVKQTDDTKYKFYKVGAISGFGTEGPLSNARENKFQVAYELYQQEKYSEAGSILVKDLESSSDQPQAIKYLGLTYLKQNQYELASQQFLKLRDFKGYKLEGLNLQVEALYANKDYADAMALVQAAINASKDNINSYINCGKLSLRLGDPIGAVNCLEDGLKVDDKNAEVQLLLGEAYIKVGAEDQGLSKLEKAAELAPDDINIWIQSGDLYNRLKKDELAQKKYEKALSLDQNNTRAQLGLAKTYLKLKQLQKAKNIAIALAGKKESAATGHYLVGLIALDNKKYGEAVLALNQATRASKDNVDAWLALADTYKYLNKPKDRVKALRSATKADPSSAISFKRLGMILLKNEEYAEAGEMLAAAIKLESDDYETAYAAAQALYKSNKLNKAADIARKAAELDVKKAEPRVLLAHISHKRGKTSEAIESMKEAIALKSNDHNYYTDLGRFYLENNLYDQAKGSLEKAIVINKQAAEPHALLGKLYTGRRLFDKAIAELEIAVKLDGSSENRLLLDTAYADKKRSLEFSQNAPQIVLEDLQLSPVFSAAYKQYASKPVGTIKVKNASGTDYGNLKVSFEIKGYMDFPTSHSIEKLAGSSVEEVPLIAAFNNKVLDIDEDIGVQVEVKVSYVREGRNDSVNVTRPMTIYGKNAIVWANSNMVGSFVTPKDDTLRDFVRRAINAFKPEHGPLSEALVTGMTLFDTFSAYGLKYIVDPNNPFTDLKEDQIDYVQFARETLKLKSGDCDDLSVLMSAGLENLGVQTAILDVPGHLLMMFNTGLPESKKDLISAQDDLLAIYNDQVWVPVEATMVAASFAEAWAEGARKFHENNKNGTLKIIPLKDAWSDFKPVTLTPANYTLDLPNKDRVSSIIDRERKLLIERSIARLIKPYEAMAKSNPKDSVARMQVAIIYAKYGLHDKAIKELDLLLDIEPNNSAIYNNRGNIYYDKGDYQRASEAYQHAERLDPNDGGVKINLALAAYKDGNSQLAREKFKEASKISKQVAEEYAGFGKLLNN